MNEKENIHKIIKKFSDKQEWMTNYILGEGLNTQGKINKGEKNRKKLSLIQSLNLNGKKVLDVGSAEGYFSFYMALQGAEVVGLELDSLRVEKSKLVAEQISEKKVSFYSRDLSEHKWVNEFGKFDYAFCYAVLHRVTDPINLIASLFEVSDIVIFEWAAPYSFISDRLSIAMHPVNGKLDARNISKNKKEGNSEYQGELLKRKPYYQLSPGFVINVSAELGANHTKLIHADKKIGLLRKIKASTIFLKNCLISNKQFAWPLTRRVILIASRKPLPNINLKIEKYASWDGSLKI
tara:strand:+ start:864 stop:1745 length:882 start_codon:yes stop_codon:yes gene_type:complete